ncbi:hypothetical protein MUP32_05605 [Candidatus Microgenomates bacterium]|nr:hypothetical protein [Candidatus Microgenomates bacterium]
MPPENLQRVEYRDFYSDVLTQSRQKVFDIWRTEGIYYGHGPSHAENVRNIAHQLLIINKPAATPADFLAIDLAAQWHDVRYGRTHAQQNADLFKEHLTSVLPENILQATYDMIRLHEGTPVQSEFLPRLFCLADEFAYPKTRIAFFIQLGWRFGRDMIKMYTEEAERRKTAYLDTLAQSPTRIIGEDGLIKHYETTLADLIRLSENPEEVAHLARQYLKIEEAILKQWGAIEKDLEPMLRKCREVVGTY